MVSLAERTEGAREDCYPTLGESSGPEWQTIRQGRMVGGRPVVCYSSFADIKTVEGLNVF